VGALGVHSFLFEGKKTCARTRRSEPRRLPRALSLSENRTPHRTDNSGLGAVIFLRRDSALPSYSYVRGRFIAEQEERERPEGGTTLGRSERRSGSGRFRRSRADSADFDGLFNGPASD
jgi:hypothetical protein